MRVSRLLHSFPHFRPFRVLQVQQEVDHLVLVLVARRHTAPCPLCGRMAHRQQSTYLRTLHDLPLMGVPVRLHLGVRRFVCANMACRRRIFAEQFPALAPARARATHQRRQMTEQIGLA